MLPLPACHSVCLYDCQGVCDWSVPCQAVYQTLQQTVPHAVGFQVAMPAQSGEESIGKGAEAGSKATQKKHGHGLSEPPQN